MSLPKTYKAVVIPEAGGEYNLKEVELKQPGEGEIVVKVSHCGVCSSDHGARDGHFGPMVASLLSLMHPPKANQYLRPNGRLLQDMSSLERCVVCLVHFQQLLCSRRVELPYGGDNADLRSFYCLDCRTW